MMRIRLVVHCVEFLGIPGSGKTTLQNKLLQSHQKRHTLSTASELAYLYKTSSLWSSVLTNIPLISEYTAIKVISLLFGNKCDEYALDNFHRDTTAYAGIIDAEIRRISTSDEQYELLNYWFNRMAARHMLSSQVLPSDRPVLIDEGFVQRTISIFCSTDPNVDLNPDTLQAYLKSIPKPDDLIIVDTPTNVAKNRLNQRTQGWPNRCEGLDKQTRDLFLERTAHCVTSVEETLREETTIRTHTVDGTENVEQITEKLEKIIF